MTKSGLGEDKLRRRSAPHRRTSPI
jgi:hypothetical protein